jgi:hypothetical protein
MRAPESAAESSLEADQSRPETVTAALLYLMTHYARTGCPRLALCISRHMQCLASHPDAAPVLRDICAGMHGAWQQAACARHDGEALH